jgi:hypothetical protein
MATATSIRKAGATMKNVTTILGAAVALWVGGPVALAQQDAAPPPPAQEDAEIDTAHAVAVAYGINAWDQVETLRFTFNVERAQGNKSSRSWSWNTQTGEVTITGIDGRTTDAVTFITGQLPANAPEHVRTLDAQFINDSYWFLFPFQLVWSNPTVTMDEEARQTPIGGGLALKVTAQWPDEGGYTPGDAYDLYLNEQGLIDQWVFRKGGAATGSPATWENHAQIGPIIVSLEHRGPDGSDFRLFFTDVQATLNDGSTVEPLPIVEP